MTILRQTWTDRRLQPGAIFDEISLSELENIFIPSLTLKKSVSLYEIYLFKQKGSSNETWPSSQVPLLKSSDCLNWMILLRMKAPDIPELFLIFWNSLDWPSPHLCVGVHICKHNCRVENYEKNKNNNNTLIDWSQSNQFIFHEDDLYQMVVASLVVRSPYHVDLLIARLYIQRELQGLS